MWESNSLLQIYKTCPITALIIPINDIMLQNHTPHLLYWWQCKTLRFSFVYRPFLLPSLHYTISTLRMSTFFKKSNLQVDQLRDVVHHLLSGIICYHQIMLQSNNRVVSRLSFQMLSTSMSRNLRHLLSASFTLSYLILKVNSIFNKFANLDMGA